MEDNDRKWFVAIVSNNTEKTCGERLAAAGYEVYVPTQKEVRIWSNGRRKTVDRVVIPARIFIRCTERQRRREVVHISFIKRFMTNCAAKTNEFNTHPIAVIPEQQINKLKFILYNSDSQVDINLASPVCIGEKVRVIRGKLTGLEGNVIQHKDGDTSILVQLDVLGCARMSISMEDLERVK